MTEQTGGSALTPELLQTAISLATSHAKQIRDALDSLT